MPTRIPLRRTIVCTLLHSNSSTHATPFAHERGIRAKGAWGNDCAYVRPSLTRPRILQSFYFAPMRGSSFVSHLPQEHALHRCGPTPRGVFASGGATRERRGSDTGATNKDKSRTRKKKGVTRTLLAIVYSAARTHATPFTYGSDPRTAIVCGPSNHVRAVVSTTTKQTAVPWLRTNEGLLIRVPSPARTRAAPLRADIPVVSSRAAGRSGSDAGATWSDKQRQVTDS